MTDWYLFDHKGSHRGPLSTESLSRAIKKGEIPADTLVAAESWFEPLGASGWRAAVDVPEIAERMEGEARKSARKLRVVPGAFSTDRRGSPDYGASVMMMPTQGPPSQDPSKGPKRDES